MRGVSQAKLELSKPKATTATGATSARTSPPPTRAVLARIAFPGYDPWSSYPPAAPGQQHAPLDCAPYPYPYLDRTAIAYTDSASGALLDDITAVLVDLRGGSPQDPGARLSVLASILAEADSRIPDTVWCARAHHYSWEQIAERIGITTSAARRRYSRYATQRSELPELADPPG